MRKWLQNGFLSYALFPAFEYKVDLFIHDLLFFC
jgi:hypothetical protein